MYIFIDESGDLGCDFDKKGTSEKFTLAMLICYNAGVHQQIKNAVKKTIKRKLNHGKTSNSVLELKGSGTTLKIKEYFLKQMPESGWDIYSITADKAKLKPHLERKTGKTKVYNFLTRELLKTFTDPENLAHVSVVIDASKNSKERKDFNSYIKTHLEITFGLDVNIYITHENSQNNAGLQAVDLFCWGIQRKETLGTDSWFSVFEDKIKSCKKYPGSNDPNII